jgi:hypothetical protein
MKKPLVLLRNWKTMETKTLNQIAATDRRAVRRRKPNDRGMAQHSGREANGGLPRYVEKCRNISLPHANAVPKASASDGS